MTTHLFDASTVTPPAWAQPGAQAEVLRLTDGRTILAWEGLVSAAVWLAREDGIGTDGRSVAGPTTIHVAEHQNGLTSAAAAELAADLLAAAALAP
jgi:hypothetical protein